MELTLKIIEDAVRDLNLDSVFKTRPSGSTSFQIEFGAIKIIVIKSELFQEMYAVLSPELYEKALEYLKKIPQSSQESDRDNSKVK